MGSSGEDPSKGIDTSAGALVWVRRRNGSWWPGKILGPDELPEGSVPSPRAGTPVKLLGRVDASVDWYNLEKSKRVKAFHCGEYDNCIEKVKAASTASHLSKRAVKYARREDAILHALELEESARLEKDPQNEEEEIKNPNESEEDGQGVKRMSVASLLKRKRSQVDCVKQEMLKRKNRRRALTKVLECSTTMMPARLSGPASGDKVCGLESDELKKNDSDGNGVSCENGALFDASLKFKRDNDVPESESSRSLFDVHLVAEEKHSAGLSSIISDAPQSSGSRPSQCNPTKTLISSGNEEKGTSKWRSKGKRNSRTRKLDEARVKTRPVTEIEFRGWSWNIPPRGGIDSTVDSSVPHRSMPYRQTRLTVNPKYDSSDFSLAHHNSNNNNNVAGSGLFDVAVEVKTESRPQRVPYISLMSRLNRQPIVGHPLAVEVLDDSSCDDVIDFYGETKHRGRPTKKSKKNSGQLSKKTRKLSALSGPHRLSREANKMKTKKKKKKPVMEKVKKGPCIACVPLNVVFSRISASLNGSGRPAPRLVSTGGK
ncbi:hypothetical protein MIMGU_mgv1a004135mg [Erythranthe guttata]|uniref:PWWP domain-containing protein n=1 Tax=Erythranthe guttata TaxID=4155 RepID=A0A022S0J1_ERYGU|nr:hypothetical protein MIMGU_mgv1a004135mg [Erythranthe guttata]